MNMTRRLFSKLVPALGVGTLMLANRPDETGMVHGTVNGVRYKYRMEMGRLWTDTTQDPPKLMQNVTIQAWVFDGTDWIQAIPR